MSDGDNRGFLEAPKAFLELAGLYMVKGCRVCKDVLRVWSSSLRAGVNHKEGALDPGRRPSCVVVVAELVVFISLDEDLVPFRTFLRSACVCMNVCALTSVETD